jgi:hypothetical protein
VGDVVDHELSRLERSLEIPAEGCRLLDELAGALLERGIKAALSVRKPLAYETQAQHGLAATRWSQDRRGIPRWDPASHQLVQLRDSAGDAHADIVRSLVGLDCLEAGEHLAALCADAEGVLARQGVRTS